MRFAHGTYKPCKWCIARPPQYTEDQAADYREGHGCDGPTTEEQSRLPCVACRGADPGCEDCEGRGWVGLFVCPNRSVADSPTNALRYILRAREGHYPVSGGLLEQSATFLRALDIAEHEIGELDKAERERRGN